MIMMVSYIDIDGFNCDSLQHLSIVVLMLVQPKNIAYLFTLSTLCFNKLNCLKW